MAIVFDVYTYCGYLRALLRCSREFRFCNASVGCES